MLFFLRQRKGRWMNKKRFFVMSLAAAALAVIGTTSVALADPTSSHSGGANANQIGVVRIDPNDPSVAYVTGRYTCPTSADPAHLFVSVKQVAGGLPDPGLKLEGSSALTFPNGAWLERHPGPAEFTCDGTWHTGTWQIAASSEYGHGSLVPGTVYVQFCWDSPDEGVSWHAYSEQFARASY
jgi:hypothetical protein